MKNKLLVIPSLLGVVLLSSCAYATKELYDGNAYNSICFQDNYYSSYSEELKDEHIIETNTHSLNRITDQVFTSFSEFKDTDLEELTSEDNLSSFSEKNYLSKDEQSFKYGYISKLFDGWYECGGHYELARIQSQKDGYASLFAKETSDAKYFAMNFQNAIGSRTKTESNEKYPREVKAYVCSFDLEISFFLKKDSGFQKETFVYSIDNFHPNNNHYCFFGFSFENYSLKRIKGIAIQYSNLKIYNPQTGEDFTDKYNGEEYGHALWTYEAFIPHSSWN